MNEADLSHVVRNRVEAAYARSDLFERPRVLMDGWARYLAQGIACPAPSPATGLRPVQGQGESQARSSREKEKGAVGVMGG